MAKAIQYPPLPQAPPDAWQESALEIIAECESVMWDKQNETSAKVRAYLAQRGLREETLVNHYVGYNLFERNLAKSGLWLPPGITIPYWHAGLNTLFGINVRLAAQAHSKYKNKYMKAKGSKTAPYGIESINGKSHVFVVEGEFDLMLILQTLRALGARASHAGAFTLGSASNRDIQGWLLLFPALQHPSRYLIATDDDRAGHEVATYWLQATRRARHWLPPKPCKDVTELWQKHGYEGVRWWVLTGLEKHAL